jgi:hypothetical protein
MRNVILASALMAAAGTPLAASAQERVLVQPQDQVIVAPRDQVVIEPSVTTGVSTTGPVVQTPDGRIITPIDAPRFREYVVQENVPSYSVDGPVEVGTILPETGVTYYDVPQQYGPSTYRYTVVNKRPLLIEPRTRRVVQVIE